MKKLHILATAAALLVTASAPSFAESRTHHHDHMRADRDYSVDTERGYNAYGAAPGAQGWGGPAYTQQSEPYADRPYGDPDSW